MNQFQSKIYSAKEACFNSVNEILNKEKYVSLVNFKFNPKESLFDNFNELINDITEGIANIKDEVKERQGDTFFKEKSKELISRMSALKSELVSKRNSILKDHFDVITAEYGLTEFLGYKQALLYLIIYHDFYGFKKNQMYEYCVIDEAQDMSLIELLYLQKMVVKNRFCIIGDLNQNLHNNPLSSWEDIYQLFDGTKITTFLLETNYRSTKNIVDFANGIISRFTNLYLPKSIEKVGNDVEIVKLDSEDTYKKFKEMISQDYKDLSKSIGVIFNNSSDKEKILEILKEEITDPEKLIVLDTYKKGFYSPRGVFAVDFENCKGLEFNKVYLFGFDLEKIENYEQAKKAFVGVTRAMNELTIFSK